MKPRNRLIAQLGHAAAQSPHSQQMADLLSLLWPEPCRVDWSRARPSAASFAFAAVPNWRTPAVIAPRRPRRVMATTIRGYNTAAQGRSRRMAQLAALAASVGATDILLPNVWIDDSAADSDTSISKYLAKVLGHGISLSISVGPTRAVQKPVLQVIGRDGGPVAFAKVGQNALTRTLVEREARNLRHVGSTLDPASGVEVPTVLRAETWRDTYVLVQSPLARGNIPERKHFVDAMRSISRLDGIRHGALHTSSYWKGLRDRVRRLPDAESTGTLRSAVAVLDDHRPSVTMPFGSWHGDMSPWNITASRGRVRVWDWEHYGTDVPAGFDVLHYEIQNRIRQDRLTPTAAVRSTLRAAPESLAPLDVPGEAAPWTALLYLIEIATRYVADGEQDGDTALGRVDWLDTNLQRQLAVLCGAPW